MRSIHYTHIPHPTVICFLRLILMQNVLATYARTTRRHSSLLFQLRSGHAPLNTHLHCISKSPTATCAQCNTGQESVHHFLMSCPAYNRQRSELRLKLGIRATHVKNLLNEPECLRPLFEYIARTRRFDQTVFGDVTPSIDKNDEAE